MAQILFFIGALVLSAALYAWLRSKERGSRESIIVHFSIGFVCLLLFTLLSCEAKADHGPVSRYTPEQIVKDMHWSYNNLEKKSLTLEEYKDDVFCNDPYKYSYVVWLIKTKSVREEIKRAIFKAMSEAEDMYCFRIS